MKTVDTPTDRTTVAIMRTRGTGRLITVPKLATILGCTRQTALTLSRHWTFPAPFDVLGDDTDRPQEVWLREEVDRWLEENPDPVRKRTPKEKP